MAEKSSLRHAFLEKIAFPTVNAVISSLIIGAVVSVLIDGKLERWKVISSMQIEREQQARVKTYDAYVNATQLTANFYHRTGTTQADLYEGIEHFGNAISAQAAYIPEELETTYIYLDNTLIVGSRLLVKEASQPLSEDELAHAGAAKEASDESQEALKTYMRLWQAGNTKQADKVLHDYFQDFVKPGFEEMDRYSTHVLNDEAALKKRSAVQ
jgi:hypothetical protein